MKLTRSDSAFNALHASLLNEATFQSYKEENDSYDTAFFPRICGKFLVVTGNIVYGKKPSYRKFRAVEIIARVPYQSWNSAIFTLLTICFRNEERALTLSKHARYAEYAQENETMHVVVISQLAKAEGNSGFVRHTLIPMFFSFFYFWISYFLYLIKPRWSYELNYLFETHAFSQYNDFLNLYGDELREKKVESSFLAWYGRHSDNQYDFFLSVRNDELIHRTVSLEEIHVR